MASYTFRYDHVAEDVYVTGTFDNWSKTQKLEKSGTSHIKKVDLPKADDKIFYKFVADGEWKHDPTAKSETDSEGNVNNVLEPSDLEAPSASAATINSAGPGASTAAMAGEQPLESTRQSAPPGAFPETPANEMPAGAGAEQMYGVNPIPASSGAGNPVNIAPGEKVPEPSTINRNTVNSQVTDDEALKASAKDSEQTFGVAPLPATGGTGNPIHLEPGEKVPESSAITGNSINSNVKLDQASYERSDAGAPVLPAPLSPTSEREASGAAAIFGGLGPQTSNMIPESSMGMGKDAPAPIDSQDSGPVISSVAPNSTTNQLAGLQPVQSKEPPSVVTDSQKEAHVDPEASSSPRALQEKDEMESELHSKVPEVPAIDEKSQSEAGVSDKGIAGMAAAGVAGAGAAAAGTAFAMRDKVTESTGKDPVSVLPESVQKSINSMNSDKTEESEPIAAGHQRPAAVQSTMSDANLPQQVAAGEGIKVPAEIARDSTSYVPEQVVASQKEAHVDPEASENTRAVQEKHEFENELMSKVPEANSAENQQVAAGEDVKVPTEVANETTNYVPEQVVASQKEAHVDPEASENKRAVQEKNEFENELMSKVPESDATGQPAPTASTALAPTAPLASAEKSTSGAPQLGDPTSGVVPLSLGDKTGSPELNAPADAPATTPAETVNRLVGQARAEQSRDVSPMTKTGGETQPSVTTGVESSKTPVESKSEGGMTQETPVVTTGVDSSEAPAKSESTGAAAAVGSPVGTPRTAATNSTPQKRGSFMDRMRSPAADSQKSGNTTERAEGKENTGKKKGFFGRLKEKLK